VKAIAILAVAASATLAHAGMYTGSGGVLPSSIPFVGPGVFSSSIDVFNDTDFPITSVVVTLQGLSHTWIGDLTATLTSPNGTQHTLFARVGRLTSGPGDSSNLGGDYTFADGGADLWAAAAGVLGSVSIPAGTFHTTSSGSSAATSMNAAFAGQNGNGTWTLTITDGTANDSGSIAGWQLTIIPAPGAAAVLGLSGLFAARRRR
jgi:subtilisin-like proprotein convertase family protein